MKQMISISAAAKNFGVSRDKLYQLVGSDPTFPVLKIGKYHKVNTILFQEWLNEKTRKGEAI